jgi:hypothetical protein
MKRHFWNVVPRPVKATALTIPGLAVLIGLAIGFSQRFSKGSPIWPPLFGSSAGLIIGVLACLWILCLGYVYADARRRAMPPIPWTLIAAFVPNLLGFLFYFALRRPIIVPCPRCAQAIYTGQRFCASCGFDTFPPAPSTTPAPSPYIG